MTSPGMLTADEFETFREHLLENIDTTPPPALTPAEAAYITYHFDWKTYQEATDDCQARGGELASVLS